MKRVFLQPGQIFVTATPTVITTVLGSCISFCIFDTKQKVGGMLHYQLPRGTDEANPNKFAEPALRNVLKEMKNRYHCQREDIVVKVLGGGIINGDDDSTLEVGKANIKKAKELVAKYRLNLIGRSVGGYKGRKVEFNTQTGKVKFQFIDSLASRNEQKRSKSAIDLSFGEKTNLAKREVKAEAKKQIDVLVIDDSPVIQKIFTKLLTENKRINLVGCASDPFEAMDIRKKHNVDVITLDVNMPKMDGVTYLKQYMGTDPVPTIMISDYSKEDSGPILDALEHGAFDYLKKPSFDDLGDFAQELIEKIEQGFKSKYVRLSQAVGLKGQSLEHILTNKQLLVIGASTGGTEALKDMLTDMPAVIPPTLIVQHIPPVFSKSFAERLNSLCPFTVVEAEHGMTVEKSTVYIAPGGKHMMVEQFGGTLKIKITMDPPVNRFRPSVDYMFNSVTKIKNKEIVAVIMTGMGNDGAKGMLALRNKGAITIGQSESSCVVYGMPKEAKILGGVVKEVPLNKIANYICRAFVEKRI